MIKRNSLKFFFILLLTSIFWGSVFGYAYYKVQTNGTNDQFIKKTTNNFPITRNDANQYYLFCNLQKIEFEPFDITESIEIRYSAKCEYLDKFGDVSMVRIPLGLRNKTNKQSLILGYGVYDDTFSDKAMQSMLSKFENKQIVVTFSDNLDSIETEILIPEKFLKEVNSMYNDHEKLENLIKTGKTEKKLTKYYQPIFVTTLNEVGI